MSAPKELRYSLWQQGHVAKELRQGLKEKLSIEPLSGESSFFFFGHLMGESWLNQTKKICI